MASEGRNLVGVDIGSSAIKLCELREGRGGERQLVRFGLHPLPATAIVDGHILDSGAVIDGLEKLFHKAPRRNVALRASGHSVIIKKISMPIMSPAELAEQITWEAEQHIPFDLAEVHIDYQVLSRREAQGQMEVLLVAAKREEIAQLVQLARDAKLKPMVIDLDAFAIQNLFEVAHGQPAFDETVALMHVGASLTTVNILSGGTTAFTRDIATGGNAITEEISRQLSIGRDEAEAYKCGGDGRGVVPREVPDIVHQVVDQIAGEVQRSLDFYLATSGDRGISRIHCSGGTANVQALLEAVHARAQIPVTLLDVASSVVVDSKKIDPASMNGRWAQAAVAMGLALRKEREKQA